MSLGADYFNLHEYVDKIKLNTKVLEHLEQVNQDFYQYIKKLMEYNKLSVVYFLIDSLYKELDSSSLIEGTFPPKLLLEKDIFFDTLQINHNRIHQLHEFVVSNDPKVPTGKYRDIPVKVAGVEEGKEKIYYWPPKPEIVQDCMNDFIKIYKTNNNLTIHNNPFIKAALAHLLFIRIHPYVDGNGRTARMIHNIKFTELINKMYNMKLKICPLNISQNIQINKLTYCNCIDNIKFNNKDNDNEALNNWFDFTLTMADEQLYYIKSRINKYSYMLEKLSTFKTDTDEHLLQEANKMKIKRQD